MKIRKKLLVCAVLTVVVILALFLRAYQITNIPPSLNWDETSIGYNAYSIMKTGRDEWGEFFPLHFKSFGEYKLPVQIYASMPGIALFGLNELGVRITPVIYGVLTVLILYFLTLELFKRQSIALISAFLLAVSPWHIQLTRGSFESSFALFWVVLGVWLFLLGFRNSKWWIVSMIPFAISVYTYNTARFFTPAFLFVLFLIYKKELLKYKKDLLFSAVLFVALMIPVIPFLASGQGNARYKLVSITDDPGMVPRINERRGMSELPKPLPRLVHNKATYVSYYFMENYLSHFSPAFLFISGAGHRQHHVQNIGQLYALQAPFLIYGSYLLIKRKHKYAPLLFSWMLLAFIPVSLTNDSIPHALRTLIAAPTYQIITAYGVYGLYLLLSNKSKWLRVVIWGVVVLIFLTSFVGYVDNYFNKYPNLYSRDWQYGYKQAIKYIEENQDDYDIVVLSRTYGEPHMFTLFNLTYDPEKFQKDPNLNRFESHDWVWVTGFDKYYFPNLGDEWTSVEVIKADNVGKDILFIGAENEIPKDMNVLETISFLDGQIAFEIADSK